VDLHGSARVAHLPDGKDLNAPEGIFVEARITAWPDDKRLALAEVTDTIGFESETDKTTTFWFTLPRAPEKPAK